MVFFSIFYKTALYLAIEKENIEMVKLLLTNDKIDVNEVYTVYIQIFNKIHQSKCSISFQIKKILKWSFKSKRLITFQINKIF